MAGPIYTPKNYLQLYNSMEGYLVGSGSAGTNFNVGSRLRSLLEAVALVEGQTHFDFWDGLRKAIPVALYEGLEFARKGGAKASGSIIVGVDEAVAVDTPVPAGIVININGSDYETTNAGVILTGNTESNLIPMQSINPGSDKNLAIGDLDIRSGRGSFVSGADDFDYAYNPVAIGGGTDQESDEEREERFKVFIAGLTRSVVDAQLAAVLSVSGVRSATAVELFPSPGWVTIFAEDGTGQLNAATQAEINKVIFGDPTDRENFPGYRGAGIRVNVRAPDLIEFEFDIEIDIDENTQTAQQDIENLVATAIQNYVNSLRIGNDFIVTELIAAAQNAHPDVIDIRILEMRVNGDTVETENYSIEDTEIGKNFVTNVDSFLIEF